MRIEKNNRGNWHLFFLSIKRFFISLNFQILIVLKQCVKLKQGLCINLEGWDRAGDERGSKGRDICIPMADSC